MISLVVVSHSRALGLAARALAAEMAPAEGGPVVEVAAGLDEERTGTSASAVADAIQRADEAGGGEGVLVLLDLGSAVMSAEMALELLPEGVAERVRLSGAPLVEGLVAAVVSAAAGSDLATCAREAERGLAAKTGHLGTPSAAPGAEGERGGSGGVAVGGGLVVDLVKGSLAGF